MKPKNAAYIQDVDRLIQETPVDLVLAHYGQPLPAQSQGEHRIACPFNEACSESQYGNLTINLTDPANVIYCHSCEVRGNLLTLIHGLDKRTQPTGGRLRGQEFKDAVRVLQQVCGDRQLANKVPVNETPSIEPDGNADHPIVVNIPLSKSSKENARKIADLNTDLIRDVSRMPPEAARYFKLRPWLNESIGAKWDVGYLPKNGRSMFRGWIVYAHKNQRGEIISYSGRDPGFEAKWERWIRDGKPDTRKPMKHKYVKGFAKGNELYGQQATRLQETSLQESLDDHGLFVVEGMNDVIKLDSLGIAAVGTCSNRATDAQVDRIAQFANRAACGKVVLLPDLDDDGEAGYKDLLWRLTERNVETQLGWSRNLVDPASNSRQPEDIDQNVLQAILKRISHSS